VQAKNLSYELREASFETQNLYLKAWFSLLVTRTSTLGLSRRERLSYGRFRTDAPKKKTPHKAGFSLRLSMVE